MKELKNKLNDLKKQCHQLEDQLDIIDKEIDKKRIEALKEIIVHMTSKKDFKNYSLVYECSYGFGFNPSGTFPMEIVCFGKNVIEEMDEFEDLITTYVLDNYNFQIQINDFAKFIYSGDKFFISFKNFDVAKIKAFASEFNFNLKIIPNPTLESIDERIKQLEEIKNKLIFLEKMFN